MLSILQVHHHLDELYRFRLILAAKLINGQIIIHIKLFCILLKTNTTTIVGWDSSRIPRMGRPPGFRQTCTPFLPSCPVCCHRPCVWLETFDLRCIPDER